MIRKILILGSLVIVPIAVWYASQYGQPDSVTFNEAIERATTSSESEQAPKVVIDARIVACESDHDLQCQDARGTVFRVEYTGSAPTTPFTAGQQHRLLGHVHDGASPYFHATQRFDP